MIQVFNFKKLIKLIIPPIFINFFFNKSFVFKNKFKTYADALKVCNKSKNFYFDKNSIKALKNYKDILTIDRFLIAPILVSILDKKNKINVLDIGGGNDPVYTHIKSSTGINVHCYVLETTKFINFFKSKIPKNLKYINNIDQINVKYLDIISFNSSIQYFDNYKKLLIKLINFNPKYVVITRTFFHNQIKDYFVIETGIKGSIHPHIFFSFPSLIKFFSKNNFRLIFDNKYNIGRYKHDFINPINFYHKDLIFKNMN
jgi:putative methyltransferase (TIGR04325 family)